MLNMDGHYTLFNYLLANKPFSTPNSELSDFEVTFEIFQS